MLDLKAGSLPIQPTRTLTADKPAVPEIACPNCQHQFPPPHARKLSKSVTSSTQPSPRKRNPQAYNAREDAEKSEFTLGLSDTEAIRHLLIEVYKANRMLNQLIEQNTADDDIVLLGQRDDD